MSRQAQEGSTWLTQVGHTALPGDKGTAHPWTWPVSRSCPLPPHQAGNAGPQAPTGEPGPGISLCQGSCNSPCPWEYLLVRTSGDAPLSQASLPQLRGPGQAQSKLIVFAGVPALQPSQGSEQKTQVPRAGAAPGAAGWQGQHFLMGSVGLHTNAPGKPRLSPTLTKGRMGGEQMARLSPCHLFPLKTLSKENPGSHCSILVPRGHPAQLALGGAGLEETAPGEGSDQRGPGGTSNTKSRQPQPHRAHLPGAPAQG